jgi:pyruvate-ferredoxin/flavodoxin oxidoreductase
MGADKNQAIKALKEAEEYNGPSIIISYAPCINHGMDMTQTMKEEKLAVDSGYWLLYRYNPMLKAEGKNPLVIDSKEPKVDVDKLLDNEKRFTALKLTSPENVEKYRKGLHKFIIERYNKYKKLSEVL